jgi:alpha-mannosidase
VATHQFEPQKGKLSRKQALLSVEPECVLPSAVKMSEERDTVMIRLVNPSREEVQAAIKTGPSLKEVHILDMLENRQKKVTSKRTGVEIPMKPGQILTLELVF